MTTAAKPLPPHGSEARYQGNTTRQPCRCRTCINGWTRAGQKRLLARLAGRPATIPAEPVTSHLAELAAANMSPRQIAILAGVDVSTVRSHAAGEFPVIWRTTAEKILAVRPGQHATDGWMSPLGAVRRCHALYTLGHGPRTIAAAHPDLTLRTVEYVVRGTRQYITVAVHNAICEVYRTLCQVPGTSSQAKLRAAKEGWHGPLAWDDIDDPNCQPDTGGVTVWRSRRPKAVIDRSRVAKLTAQGHSAAQIAEIIGCNPRSVSRVRGEIARAARHDEPAEEAAA
ncbi:helix-turn-helix domain-containing protein [Streptomyces sp. NPDC001276]|uniref:helix-turn-helix domain-containing protein n=1 Tax=Streptomyces sp. NPDC001276 TaxID=3364555 RepID=UPI0036CEF6FD